MTIVLACTLSITPCVRVLGEESGGRYGDQPIMSTRSYVETIGLVIPLFLITAIGDVPVTAVEPLRPTATLSPDPPECVARYAQYLKEKYAGMPTLPDGDWPPSLRKQYTRLAMIEQERELPGPELVATMERDGSPPCTDACYVPSSCRS